MKTHLVIHHSFTADGNTLSWPVIRKNHMARGWRDIGYHFGVEWVKRSGTSGHYEMLIGRPFLSRAAAAYQGGFNQHGVHTCFIGNYDKRKPPLQMWEMAMPHLADLIQTLQIPIENVIGHREIPRVTKSCPGVQWNMDRFRNMLSGQP